MLFKKVVLHKLVKAQETMFFVLWAYDCNEIDRLIARAKVRVLNCITVVFECNARTCSNSKRD